MNGKITKFLAILFAVIMIVSIVPSSALAIVFEYNENDGDDYYNVISKREWDIAPGVLETELVLNNDTGTRRQVLHTATVDVSNPFVKVIPGYKGMWPQAGNYSVQSTSTQALEAEKLGYGNVVVATNTTLSWYTEAYYKQNPHLVGEPLGYSIIDGEYYTNSRGHGVGASTVIVINYDNHPITGEARPADMPKVWIRNSSDPLTGWEEQAIPVSFGYLVKPDANGNPVNQYSKDHGSGIASRTFVGVKADGSFVIAVSDGEQAPFSTGFTSYEMADYMIKMGCVIAANCDGGGSTTFCSQRPGEDFKVNCSLADGGERPTTSTILVISTAPADGMFARASLSTEYDYYTPGSSVKFEALGTDAVGTKVEIPEDVEWKIKEEGMGSIVNGVFTSSGKEGKATAQMIYDGKVVGERTVTVVNPDKLFFTQPVVTIPFGKTAEIPVKASIEINGVDFEIGLGANDVTFTTTNAALGSFSGLNFVAVEEADAPADITSTVTATLNMGTNPTATVQLNLGKASEILWGFEGGQADIDVWNVVNNRKNAAHWDYELALSLADKTNGQVHDGNYSMRLETNGLSSKDSHAEQYAWIRLGVDGEATILENARRVGFWLYVPEDNLQCMVQGHYMTDSNSDGIFDTEAIVNMMEQENVYYNIDESGWHYLSMDVSAFKEIALKAATKYDKDPADGMKGEKGEFFIALIFHKATNNLLWSNNGSINGKYTYYIDNFTVDYSEAVDDRENPVFGKIYLDGTTALAKREVIITDSNSLNLSASVEDQKTIKDANKNDVILNNVSGLNGDTAKVYIDGVEVNSTFANGVISSNGIEVADGYHRVKFEICDNAGNKSSVVRVIKVESGEEKSTLSLVPADATLDRIPFGSVYWMNLEATAIETIQSVSAVIDLNNVNHWELDHMELAEGFTAEYTINEETNTANITITRTGDNIQTGKAVLAELPVRILYFDTDIKTPSYTAETYWTSYPFWPQDMKMDVDMGLITHANGTTSTFSNEEFHVDTEMFTDRPHMSQVEYEYLAAHGTTHVHTPVAIADKAPSCTEGGYEGRTFCEGCNSVVEWGTTLPRTAHTYKADITNKKLVCDCGRPFTGTGLQYADGKCYYSVAGVLNSGWITIDDEWYYFDEKTFASVPTYFNGYVTYEFEPDGKLVSGVWHKTSAGSRYYEGPSYLRGGKNAMTWYTIDGKEYCMEKSGYVATGTRWVNDQARQDIFTWYTFDENGVCQGRWMHNGIAEWNGTKYYLKDGVSQYGMYLVDGDYYYFYFNDFYAGIRNQRFYCKYNNGLLPQGYYRFDRDGKLLDDVTYCVDGTLYYFVKGNETKGNGTVEINGAKWNVEDDGKVLFNGFHQDADGALQYFENGVQVGTHKWNNGEVTVEATCASEGTITYTCGDCNDVKTFTLAKLPHLDEDENYECDNCNSYIEHEHVWDKGIIVTPATCTDKGERTFTCKCGVEKSEAIEAPGHIDENGDLRCDICDGKLLLKTGLVFDADGNVRYYSLGIATRAGLVADSEGNYYYINSSKVAVKNCRYAFSEKMSNGLLPAGEYEFGADGKMVNPPAGNAHVHVWGEGVITTAPTCTDSGIRAYICECGLSKTEEASSLGHGDETDDFICDRCNEVLAHEPVWNEGEITTPATCKDEGVKTYTCKCGETKTEAIEALGHIDEDENIYCDRCGEAVAHIHKWDEGKITTPATCTDKGEKTFTCECGETTTEAVPALGHTEGGEDFRCDRCNEVLPHDHMCDSDVITTPATCTDKGEKTFICKCGEAMGTENIEAPGHIDENGDLRCDICDGKLLLKTGLVFDTDGNVRYYSLGIATRAGLVADSEGNYYYINSSKKAVKDCMYAFSEKMSNGLLPAGEYEFGADGKMVNPPAGNAHVHVWGEGVITTAPTCTDSGIRAYICECGLSKTEEAPSLGHGDETDDFICDRCNEVLAHEPVWNEGEITTPATCKDEGVKTYTCKCGETKTEVIEALGHIDEDENIYCDRCGEAVAHIHKWDDGKITTPATCTDKGEKTFACECGETKTEAVPALGHTEGGEDFRCDRCNEVLDHEHVWNKGEITSSVTCTDKGEKTFTCKCGETKTEAVSALGHIDENGNLSCDRCDGKLLLKTGLVFDADGNIRYYVAGVATRAGLVQDSKGNYYYINSSKKAVKNCMYAFSDAMSNGLLPAGEYQFDADGKLVF